MKKCPNTLMEEALAWCETVLGPVAVRIKKAVMVEGMLRLQKLGCTWVFATAYDPATRSVIQPHLVTDTWVETLKKDQP